MNAPLVITETLVPQPIGGGWFYTRTWHMAGHWQSGLDYTERVSPYIIIGREAAIAEVRRAGTHAEADHQLLLVWENNGRIH